MVLRSTTSIIRALPPGVYRRAALQRAESHLSDVIGAQLLPERRGHEHSAGDAWAGPRRCRAVCEAPDAGTEERRRTEWGGRETDAGPSQVSEWGAGKVSQ